MTVPVSPRKAGPFAGNGVVTSFAWAFKVFTKSDIAVITTNALGGNTTLVLDSDYSVSLNLDQDVSPGGTITYPISGSPLPNGSTLVIASNLPIDQETDITNLGGFFPDVIENALDRAVMLIGQQAIQIGSGLRFPVSDSSLLNAELPPAALRAGTVLGFDGSGNVIAAAGTGAISISAAMVPVVQAGTVALGRTALGATATGTSVFTAASATIALSSLGITLGAAANNVPQLDGSAKLVNSVVKHPTQTRSINTILAAADNNTAIKATGTFNQTITNPATLGDGWHVFYRNDGTGIVTLTPAAGTIDGQSAINLYTGEACLIVSDGANLKTYGRSTGLVMVSRQVIPSAVATVDFTIGVTSDFDEIYFDYTAVIPATNGTSLYVRVTEDGGATFKAAAGSYSYITSVNAGGVSGFSATADTGFQIGVNQSSTASFGGWRGRLTLPNASSSSFPKQMRAEVDGINSAGSTTQMTATGGYFADNGAINGIRFIANSGNINSGIITMYGLRKS